MRVLIIIISTVCSAVSQSRWDNLTANIAVVEFQPSNVNNLRDALLIESRVKQYKEILHRVTNKTKLNMIVFPEESIYYNTMGYTTAVKLVIGDNPCNGGKTYPQFVKDLSCAAVEYKTYLVTNLIERVNCKNPSSSTSENCRVLGAYFFVADVVFDKKGTIISRYRVSHPNLYRGNFDRPSKPEVVTFDTDFGIKFGILNSFDILYKNPSEDILSKGIDGIIYQTSWTSQFPFLTALQTQQMFAYAHNVTFFAAGLSTPQAGLSRSSGGSAIYRGFLRTVSNTLTSEEDSEILIYQSVNGSVTSTASRNLTPEIDPLSYRLENFTGEILNTSQKSTTQQVCHGDKPGTQFCCNFTVRLSNDEKSLSSLVYFLVAYTGIRTSYIFEGGVEICAIIGCPNSSLSSCGTFPVGLPSSFDEITIRANFEVSTNKTQFPNSLLRSLRPIDANQTNWSSREFAKDKVKMVERTFSVNSTQNDVLTFAIFGRDFGKDPRFGYNTADEVVPSAAFDIRMSASSSIFLLNLLIITVILAN